MSSVSWLAVLQSDTAVAAITAVIDSLDIDVAVHSVSASVTSSFREEDCFHYC